MTRFQFVFTIMSMEKVQYSVLAEGEDRLLSKLSWDIEPNLELLELRQNLLQLSLGRCWDYQKTQLG